MKYTIASMVVAFCLQPLFVFPQDTASLKRVIEYCNDQLKYAPSLSVYETRADAKNLLGDYEGALADYKNIATIQTSSNIYYKIGLILYYLKKYRESEEYLDKSISLDKNNVNSYFARANLKQANNKSEAAIKDYTKAISIDPQNALIYNNRGYIYQILNRDSTAIKDFTASINLDTTNTNSYYNRGYSKYKTGDFNGAINDIDKALDIYPESIYSIKYLILIYKKMGNKEKLCSVIRKYKKVIMSSNLEPEYKNACN